MKHNFDEIVNRRNSESEKWDTFPSDILPMWVADSDFKCPKPIIDALAERVERGLYGYALDTDKFPLAVKNWQQKRFAWKIDTSWVEATPAVLPAIVCAIRAFSSIGDNIVIQTPVYHPFYKIIPDNGRHVVTNELVLQNNGSYEIDFVDLAQKLSNPRTTIFLLCSPHNPTGKCFTKEELTKIGKLCLENNVFILSDEIHADLVYGEHKHTPFASISTAFAEKCIVFLNPAKTFNIAGIRIGAAIIPNYHNHELFFSSLNSAAIAGSTTFGTLALEIAYNECDYYADQLVEYIGDNIKYLQKFLANNIPQIKVGETQATYLVWLDCRGLNMTPEELNTFFLEKAKVAMNNGISFGNSGAGFMRMNLACPRVIIVEALERIANAVRNNIK